jgi:hypothetical protein
VTEIPENEKVYTTVPELSEETTDPFMNSGMALETPDEEDLFVDAEEFVNEKVNAAPVIPVKSGSAIFDTGSSLNYIPTADYKTFISFLTADQ